MQQVAHIFSRIERSKIYQFGSFSLRSPIKSELNFASSFASKLRKFGRKKSELIAAIFPSRVTQMQLKIVQGFARSCDNIVRILIQYPHKIRMIFASTSQRCCSKIRDNLRPYLNKDHHIIRAKLMPSSSVILTLLTGQKCNKYYSYSRQKLAQFWPGFDANNGINFYQATA